MKEYTYHIEAFSPAFAGCTNESIYDGLCAATTPMDAGLRELHQRLRPIIVNAAQGYLKALAWTLEDAIGEALIFLWDLVRKHSYNRDGGAPFHNFFGSAWRRRLNKLFESAVLKGPVFVGSVQTGWCDDQPVYSSVYAEHPKAAEYRQKNSARQAAYHQRKLAEQGKEYHPRKLAMSAEESREKARQRSREYFASLTPEEKAERYARSNERRRAARAAETPEQRAARIAHRNAIDRARKLASMA